MDYVPILEEDSLVLGRKTIQKLLKFYLIKEAEKSIYKGEFSKENTQGKGSQGLRVYGWTQLKSLFKESTISLPIEKLHRVSQL